MDHFQSHPVYQWYIAFLTGLSGIEPTVSARKLDSGILVNFDNLENTDNDLTLIYVDGQFNVAIGSKDILLTVELLNVYKDVLDHLIELSIEGHYYVYRNVYIDRLVPFIQAEFKLILDIDEIIEFLKKNNLIEFPQKVALKQ